ncbi:uncharacterized protein [Dysidea avara]|uniref:uncharacterized protein n=1 Tax=Dysidea avara TaxID=196820 RepID=UPI00332F08B4
MAKSFTSPHVAVFILNATCMSIFAMISFVEDASTFQGVPVVGSALYYLGTNWRFVIQALLGLVLVIHIGEAFYAFYLARSMKMSFGDVTKWTLQTLFLGILSLKLLMAKYKEEKKS